MQNRWIVTPSFFEQPEPALAGIAPADAVINHAKTDDRSASSMGRLHAPIRQFVVAQLGQNLRPVSLAGDCCAALPVLAGMQQSGLSPSLVWLDAHGDFNTPQTSPSGFLGGMPLAMLSGRGPQWLCAANGLVPLQDRQITLVDARDLDPLEKAALRASSIRHIKIEDLARASISGPVHLHIDTDILNAKECDAFNYPVPGGPLAAHIKQAVKALDQRADIRALSISGWTGALEKERNAQKIFAEILAHFGAALRPL